MPILLWVFQLFREPTVHNLSTHEAGLLPDAKVSAWILWHEDGSKYLHVKGFITSHREFKTKRSTLPRSRLLDMISIIFSDLSRDFFSIVQMYQFVISPISIEDGYQIQSNYTDKLCWNNENIYLLPLKTKKYFWCIGLCNVVKLISRKYLP